MRVDDQSKLRYELVQESMPMDISKWLCDTTLSPPPQAPANRDRIDVAAAPTGLARPLPIERSKRNLPIADSSVIEIPKDTRRGQKRRKHHSLLHSESSQSGTPGEHDSSSSIASAGSDEESASTDPHEHRKYITKSYERRPRHKTRPDKYLPKEPKPKKINSRHDRKKDAKTTKKNEGNRPPEESMDLVKSFKTAHVANDRLTVGGLLMTKKTHYSFVHSYFQTSSRDCKNRVEHLDRSGAKAVRELALLTVATSRLTGMNPSTRPRLFRDVIPEENRQ